MIRITESIVEAPLPKESPKDCTETLSAQDGHASSVEQRGRSTTSLDAEYRTYERDRPRYDRDCEGNTKACWGLFNDSNEEGEILV